METPTRKREADSTNVATSDWTNQRNAGELPAGAGCGAWSLRSLAGRSLMRKEYAMSMMMVDRPMSMAGMANPSMPMSGMPSMAPGMASMAMVPQCKMKMEKCAAASR